MQEVGEETKKFAAHQQAAALLKNATRRRPAGGGHRISRGEWRAQPQASSKLLSLDDCDRLPAVQPPLAVC